MVDHLNSVPCTSSISVEKSFSKLSTTVAEANKKNLLFDTSEQISKCQEASVSDDGTSLELWIKLIQYDTKKL